MPQPFDYRINVRDPFESAISGLQVAQGIQTLEANRETQQASIAKSEQQAALGAERRKMLSKLMGKKTPTARDIMNLGLFLGKDQTKGLRENFENFTKERQENELRFSSQALAALQSGDPQIGIDLLNRRAEAERNSGNEPAAKMMETWAKIAGTNPGVAYKSLGAMVSQFPGGDEVIKSITALGKERRAEAEAPIKLTEAQAKAEKAAIDAQYAESNAIIDLEKKGWDVDKLKNDIKISKENTKIAAMNAQLKRETNELKRTELRQKIDNKKLERDEKTRERIAEVESARSNIDNLLNTADRIIGTSIGVVEDATGPISARLPTLSQDVADFEALIENFDAQAFMAQIPQMKGMGALSEGEGRKLAASLQNLNLKQSPQRLIANVREAQRIMLKARETLASKYGVPETVPDTPMATAATSPTDINELIQRYAPGGP